MRIQSALVIDDDKSSRELARDILVTLGIGTVHFAADGNEAIRQLQMLPPLDLLMCEVFLPGKDGIEVIGELAKVGYCGGLILMGSGYLQMLDFAAYFAQQSRLDLWAAIHKPLTVTAVAAAIESGRAASQLLCHDNTENDVVL